MTFKAGPPPTQLPIGEAAPKRGPGRPRKDGSAPQPRPLSKKPIKESVKGLLGLINVVLMMVPPLTQDQFDDVEIEALADAIAEECLRNPRFAKMINGALAAAGGAGLFGVIGIIAIRRVARHQVLPEFVPRDLDPALGQLLAMTVKMNAPAQVFTPPEREEPAA